MMDIDIKCRECGFIFYTNSLMTLDINYILNEHIIYHIKKLEDKDILNKVYGKFASALITIGEK